MTGEREPRHYRKMRAFRGTGGVTYGPSSQDAPAAPTAASQPEDRYADALERIAKALERLAERGVWHGGPR